MLRQAAHSQDRIRGSWRTAQPGKL
jgi:hypothetical protein